MARTVADYAVAYNVPDSVLTLNPEGRTQATFEFHIPPGAVREAASILAFTAQALETDDLKLDISIADLTAPHQRHSVLTLLGLSSDVLRTIHEVVQAGVLTPGVSNGFEFKVSGEGKLQIRDVVLWFQREDQG